MPNSRARLSYKDVASVMSYDPASGKLFWLERHQGHFMSSNPGRCKSWNTQHAGREAFTATGHDGYKLGLILRRRERAHRLAWLLFHKKWPDHLIDHIDGDKSNNRIKNLRDVPMSVNLKNASRNIRNTSGVNGVSWDKRGKKWYAQITVNGKRINLGLHDTIESASAARAEVNAAHSFTARHGTPSECVHSSLKSQASPFVCAQPSKNYSRARP